MREIVLEGIIPASIVPFHSDYSVDEEALRMQIRYLLSSRIGGIAVPAHAGELYSLSREEVAEVVRTVVKEARGKVPVISGVEADFTLEAIQMAKDAKDAGADAIMIFPPMKARCLFTSSTRSSYGFFKAIDDAVNLPIVIFQYPAWRAPGRYTIEVLFKLAEIENVIAIKEGDNPGDIHSYEEDYRALKSLDKKIYVLSAFDHGLLPTFAIGADGALIGYGNIFPELHVELFELMKREDLKRARKLYDRLAPVTEAIWRTSAGVHAAPSYISLIKEALVIIGKLEKAIVRPPLLPPTEEQKKKLRDALRKSKII